jgi:hypothetical protein
MEEVHYKGGFLGELKGSNIKINQAYIPLSCHLLVRSRSRKGMGGNEVIFVPIQDNKQCASYIDNYQVIECNNDPLDTRQSIITMYVANCSSKLVS